MNILEQAQHKGHKDDLESEAPIIGGEVERGKII